jgi:hypothetical protein
VCCPETFEWEVPPVRLILMAKRPPRGARGRENKPNWCKLTEFVQTLPPVGVPVFPNAASVGASPQKTKSLLGVLFGSCGTLIAG